MSDLVLSIGIPAFNAENSIDACIRAILNSRRIGNYEIVCVDDGSTDKTGIMLDNWAKHYDCIKVFHTENKGAFLARERIIVEARGEWIGFVDADDIVLPDMFIKLLESGNDNGADISVCAYYNKRKVHMDYFGNGCIDLIKRPENIGRILAINPAYWNKIYRRDVVNKAIQLDYSPKIMEDSLFFCSIIPYIKRISFVKEPLYCYESSNTGVTSSIGINDIKEAKKGIALLLKRMRDQGVFSRPGMADFFKAFFTLHFGVAFSINSNEKKSFWYVVDIWNTSKRYLNQLLPNWKNSRLLSFSYANRHKEIRRVYLGSILYKSIVWPLVAVAYNNLNALTGMDLKW